MKVQISMADELMERIDAYADKSYMSRSGLISLACTQYLAQHEAIAAVKDIAFSIRKISDTGKIDPETEKKLKEFELFTKILTGQE